MKVGASITLLDRLCPDCGQGSCLTFVACPDCGHVALLCDEAGYPAFPDPRNLETRVDPSARCQACGGAAYTEFRLARRDEVLAAGFAFSELA